MTRKNIIARTVSSNNKIVSSRFFEQSQFEQMIMSHLVWIKTNKSASFIKTSTYQWMIDQNNNLSSLSDETRFPCASGSWRYLSRTAGSRHCPGRDRSLRPEEGSARPEVRDARRDLSGNRRFGKESRSVWAISVVCSAPLLLLPDRSRDEDGWWRARLRSPTTENQNSKCWSRKPKKKITLKNINSVI